VTTTSATTTSATTTSSTGTTTTTQPDATLVEKVVFKAPLELTIDILKKVVNAIVFWD
jgi:hypothetical protein